MSHIRILVIADDLTGAFDTGIQFVKAGMRTCVCMPDQARDFSSDAQAVVVDTETRHASPAIAYEQVFRLTRKGCDAGFDIIYKKTDSGLRGNIGAELAAVLRASGRKQLIFAPGYPKAGRTTKRGVQYWNGLPIASSPFGADPFSPVLDSYVPDIIARQAAIDTIVIEDSIIPIAGPDKPAIYVMDADTTEALQRIVRRLPKQAPLLLAGCAGFAEQIAADLRMPCDAPVSRPSGRLLVISGSLNPISIEQVQHARDKGFFCVSLEPEQLLMPRYEETEAGRIFMDDLRECISKQDDVIIESASSAVKDYAEIDPARREQAAHHLGHISAMLQKWYPDRTHFIIGGDTLLSALKHAGCSSLMLLEEISQGVVLAKSIQNGAEVFIVTKSGGYGDIDAITGTREYLADMAGED